VRRLWKKGPPRTAEFPFVGYRLGRLVVTTCSQPAGAPFIDDAWTNDVDGRHYTSKAILLTPWRRTRHGERPPMRAVVVGWRT
jgi:hypothetical protein